MPREWENTINDAVSKFIGVIGDIAKLEISTMYVVVGENGVANFDEAKPAAKTVIELEGDYLDYIPVRLVKETDQAQAVPQIDRDLYRMHQENVEKAMAYRSNLFSTVMAGIKSLMG
jgi:hypothetical protein